MKKGTRSSFILAVLAVSCWAFVSDFYTAPACAQAGGAIGEVSGFYYPDSLVKYTLIGDADLDGVINGADFAALVGNLSKLESTWNARNFNVNGITGEDFTALVGNLGKQGSGANVALPAADIAAIDAFAAANGLMPDVPEPASLGLLAISGLAILTRRRRRA